MRIFLLCYYLGALLLLVLCAHIMLSPFIIPNLKFVKYVQRRKKNEIITWIHFAFSFNLHFLPSALSIFVHYFYSARASVCVCACMICWCWCWCFGLLLVFFLCISQWARFVLHYFCIVWEFSLELRMLFFFLVIDCCCYWTQIANWPQFYFAFIKHTFLIFAVWYK